MKASTPRVIYNIKYLSAFKLVCEVSVCEENYVVITRNNMRLNPPS